MGYLEGITICYGVDVTPLVSIDGRAINFCGQEWDWDHWQYCDELYPCQYLNSQNNDDSTTDTDEDLHDNNKLQDNENNNDEYNGPVVYTDKDGYSGQSNTMILSFENALRSYQGGLDFANLPEILNENKLVDYCKRHGIIYAPCWWVLMPRH